MRKAALIIALAVLGIAEICLFSALLPVKWQITIFGGIGPVLPHSYDYSRVTHPALEHEIDQALNQLPALKVALYALIALLLALNTWATMRVLKRLWKYLNLANGQLLNAKC